MSITLLKALVALVPTSLLLSASVVLFLKRKTTSSLLQLLSAGCLVIVMLTHVCEALQLFPWMHWGANMALVIIWMPPALLLVLRCFPWDISFTRLQSDAPNRLAT
jgi:hypothetical protein